MEIPYLSFFRIFLFWVLPMCSLAAKLEEDLAILIREPLATLGSSTSITVYTNPTTTVEFLKAVFMSPNMLIYEPVYSNPSDVINISNEEMRTTLNLASETTRKDGIYKVKVATGASTNITVIISNGNAFLESTEFPYVVLSEGSELSLHTRHVNEQFLESQIRWRHNGKPFGKTRASFTFNESNLSVDDEGVYECFENGDYRQFEHAVMSVIVRECPENRWGPTSCQNECPACENGGVCSDETGSCLCPPGFSGQQCERAHGRNVFGQNGQYKCDETGDDHDDGCRGFVICYIRPFGCSCPAGYTGIYCDEDCEEGKYGANCAQTCTCVEGETCARDTGRCYTTDEDHTSPPDLLRYRKGEVLTFSTVSSSSINVSWPEWQEGIDVGIGPVTGYLLLYRSGSESFTTVNVRLSLSHVIDGLEADTEYEFKLAVMGPENMVGPMSDLQVQKTHCTEITSVPALSVVGKTARDVTFSLELPTSDELTCSDRSYNLFLQRMDESGQWQNIERLGHVSEVTATDILPCTSYNFRIEISWSPAGIQSPITSAFVTITSDAEEPGGVGNLSSYAPQRGIIMLSWTAPKDPDNPCAISSYRVDYRLVRHKACRLDETNSQVETVTTQYLQRRLRYLQDYSDYEVTVRPVVATSDGSTVMGREVSTPASTLANEPTGTVVGLSGQAEGNSIEFSWDPLSCHNVNGPGLHYSIELNQEIRGSLSSVISQETADNRHRFNNLKSCGNYVLYVTPKNNAGEGQSAISSSIQTDEAALNQVPDVSLVKFKDGLYISWQEPDTTTSDCPVIGYQLTYTVNRYLSCPDPANEETLDVFVATTPYILTDLNPFTLYKVRVAARGETSEHNGPYSDPPSYGQTEKRAPSYAPVVSVDDARSTSRQLVFTWESIPCKFLNGIFQSYKITSNGTTREQTVADQNVSSRTITGLNPCTYYDFHIRVVNDIGDGPTGEIVASTGIERPGNIFNLRLQAESDTTILGTWERPHTHPCTIARQDITIEMVDRDDCSQNIDVAETFHLKSSVRFRRFIGLVPNSLYRISIWATNSAGAGPTLSEELRTRQSKPTLPPGEIEVKKISATFLKLVWVKPPCGSRNGEIKIYHCRLRTNGVVIDRNTTSRRVLFDDLIPYSNYSFEVSAVTAIGEGPYSEQFHIMTNESYPSPVLQPKKIFANTSTIHIEWEIPHPPHGIILGYDIFVRLAEFSPANFSNMLSVHSSDIGNPPTALIPHLQANTNYSIQVRAKTRVGPGNWSEELILITAEGRPGPPSNVNFIERTLTTIKMGWNEPLQTNGQITKYKIRSRAVEQSYSKDFRPGKFTSNIHDETEKYIVYEIPSLEPSTVYEIEISAYTSAGKGETVLLTERTDFNTDLEPVQQRLTTPERMDTAAIITIPALTQTYATGYVVRVKQTGNSRRNAGYSLGFEENPQDYIAAEVNKSDAEIEFTVGDNKTYGRYHNAPLQKDRAYQVSVATFTTANGEMFVSAWSDPVVIPASRQGSPALLIILIIVFLIAIVMVVLIILYLRKEQRKQKEEEEYSARNDRERAERPEIVMVPNETPEEIEMKTGSLKDIKKPPVAPRPRKSDKVIKIADLASYVKRKKTSETENFFQEYETLPDSFQYPWDVAAKPENKKKNRYGNIIPYNSSRVVLEVYNNDPHSDYINASYIDGYKYPTKYIASHGPNTASVKDFWRMIWQEDVGKIVMLTNVVEMGKKKCEKYWPDDALKYANVIVTLKEETKDTSYTVRTFELSLVDKEETKLVRQFHFTAWPDMKVPEFAGPILDLLQIVRNEESHQAGPMVVHCSAGVGRTGTFIALDAMLDMAAAEDRINVYQFVCQMRQNRVKMVQIPEQYQFIFDALVEYFVIGNTSIQVDDFRSDLGRLNEINVGSGKSYLEEQYETLELTSVVPPESKFKGGKSSENKRKNRFRNRIPVDTYRPYLMTDVGDLGNNYINASFLSGYKKKDMFLGTQMPLENTVTDFWRMVWDYNSRVIIMLNDMDNQNMAEYWHETGSFTCGPFSIQLLSCEDITGIRCRNLEITNSSQSFENPRLIKHLQCLNWPNSVTAPDDPKILLHAVNMLSRWDAESDVGPVTVHCIDGIGRTGLFCTLVSAVDQINAERKVDIFQLVNKLRSSRPNMVDSFEQYKCIFDTILLHLEDYDSIYENFGR